MRKNDPNARAYRNGVERISLIKTKLRVVGKRLNLSERAGALSQRFSERYRRLHDRD